ncbi:MAG: hypothetical protein V3S51_01525 [Dehalococcoidia bacterium]
MELKYDVRYCPQCYQYDADADGLPEACKICFGQNKNGTETSFEAAFVVLADIDGRAFDDATETASGIDQGATEILLVGNDTGHRD